MNDESSVNLSRRGFLKLSGTAVAVAALSNLTGLSAHALVAESHTGNSGNTSDGVWKKSYCSSCIWPNCGIDVEVKEGIAVKLRGNPDSPFNKGSLCPRGSAQLASLYNPYRVKAPMKRTNPKKGLDVDPGWVEISWEEAFNIIAEKLKAIRESDPRKFVVKFGFSSQIHESRNPVITAMAFGTPNHVMTSGPLCEVHYSPMMHHGTYVDKIDLGYCDYLISIGRTVGFNFAMASGPTRGLTEALDRGMKLVVVDPRCSPEASKGEWIPIRPATDLAFALSMLNVILHELDRYDVYSVKKRTNGPYLIGPDGDYIRQRDTGKPMIWDPVDGTVKCFDEESINDYALEGTILVGSTNARPSFDLMKESVKTYTPEWAEKITSVPAETIRRITREFVDAARLGSTINIDGVSYPYRPVCVAAERGSVNHLQGRNFHFITGVINALMGAWDVPGSLCAVFEGPPFVACGHDGTIEGPGPLEFYPHGRKFKFPPDTIELKEFYPITLGQPHVMARAVTHPEKYYLDYKVEAIMVHGANAIMNNANPEEVVESYRNIPFAFSIAYHFDEPTMLCDIVLPESSNFERYQVYIGHEIQAAGKDTMGLHITNYKYPVVEQIFDTKQAEEITFEIAERVGFLLGPTGVNAQWNKFAKIPEKYQLSVDKRYTYREICDIRLRAMHGDNKGESYFIENGFISSQVPLSRLYNYYHNPHARVEIYARSLMNVGRKLKANLDNAHASVPGWDMDDYLFYYMPLPKWKETFLFTAPEEYDLFVINWKISARNLGIGGQDDNPWLREVVETWEHGGVDILMNERTAERKGFKAGDQLIIKSQHGSEVEGVLQTTRLLHPEVIGIAGQGGHYSMMMHPAARHGVHYNRLISSSEGYFCPSGGGIDLTARVSASKR